MDFTSVSLTMTDDVKNTMEERGVREEDIRAVLEYSHNGGAKLYDESNGHFLGKKRIGNFTVNLEYSIGSDYVEIIDMYCHVVKLASD